MAWVKGLHIVAVIFWSASLIYLPILMAGHSPRLSNPAYLRLHGMVRRIYLWVASPFAIAAIVSGTALIPLRDVTAPWFAVKLLFVAALAVIHARCGIILAKQSHRAERANAVSRLARIGLPIILFPCVLWLVLAKPAIRFSLAVPSVAVKPLLRLPVPQTPACHPANRPPTPAANLAWIDSNPTDRWRRPGRASA